MPRGQQPRIRPRDYLAAPWLDGTNPEFGESREAWWALPEGGTQAGCAAAQLQHSLTRSLKAVMESDADGTTEFCSRHGLDVSRLRKALRGDRAMTLEDIGAVLARLRDPQHAVALLNGFLEPTTFADAGTKVVKGWPAESATVETWKKAREYLNLTVPDLVRRYMPWSPHVRIDADKEPLHADQPASGFVDGHRGHLRLYLDESWGADIVGYQNHEGPVIAVDRDTHVLTVLDLRRVAHEEYEFVTKRFHL